MIDYLIRKAKKKDIPFLADVVIAAEKGNSNILGFSTLFNLSEDEVKILIIEMFNEEIEGCEFSLDNYLVVDYEKKQVAAFSGWVEEYNGLKPSKILKSNMISYFFDIESLEYFESKASIIKDLTIDREAMSFQLEYLYVSEEHRGKNLAGKLIQKLEEIALVIYPDLKKIQVQVMKNNIIAVKVYERNGFKVVRTYKSNNAKIIDYLPFNEKYLMEKNLKEFKRI